MAGIVIEVAEKSTSPFKVGDKVFGTCRGSLADRVCVSSASLGHKPTSVSFVQAAAMPTSYVTSLQALRGLIANVCAPQFVSVTNNMLLSRATNTTTSLATDYGKLSQDGRVLVIGASGGCGIAGLQLAQYLGASEVIGVTSTRNRELVLQEGATGYFDYTITDIAERCGARVTDNLRFVFFSDIVLD